jgi:hypothetical protein
MKGNGYIPQTAAAMAINELLSVINGGLKLDNGLVEALMASRVNVLKAVDHSPDLQRLVEQLAYRIAGQLADED